MVSGAEVDLQDARSVVSDVFPARIDRIIQVVTSLQRVFCEDVVSCDIYLDVPRPSDHFDAVKMEDIGGSDPKGASGNIICTVGVGLSSMGGALRTTTVLMSKVVSETVVYNLLRGGKKQQLKQRYCEYIPFFLGNK